MDGALAAAAAHGHVVGVGVDLVEVARVGRLLSRRGHAAGRLFTDLERSAAGAGPMRTQRLAARFAAKEAVYKALGGHGPLGFQDIEVVRPIGRPAQVRLHGAAAELAARRGVSAVLVSMSHVGSLAMAQAVAVGPCPCGS